MPEPSVKLRPKRSASDPGFSYYLPEVPRKHTVLHIPGSHTLYVGPRSCARRHDIHARQYGDRKDVSFLFITQADVVTGRYEDLMVEAIGQLREVLPAAPRIFFLAVFCIDDFLGTDENALIDRLSATYPDCQFAIEHIDPVSLNERQSMAAKKQTTQYSFIKRQPPESHDRGINLTGVFVPFHPDCELLSLVEEWGAGPLRSLMDCETYEDYQAMGKSTLTLVFRLMNRAGADLMRDQLDIPYVVATPGYDARAVADCYNAIARALGAPERDFVDEVAACRRDAEETARLLDGMPVAIDCEFSLAVFAAAKALLEYGFNVTHIFHATHKFKLDEEAERFIREQHPEIMLTRASDHERLFEETDDQVRLGIGADCSRVLRTRHSLNIWHDEGYFGFHGIHRLMADIREALTRETDWSDVPELNLSAQGKGRR